MNGSASELFLSPYDGTPHPPLVQKRRCSSALESCSTVEDWETAEEEDDCQFLNVQLRRSGNPRSSAHAYDTFRRHSWEPGKVLEEPDFDQQSDECGVTAECPFFLWPVIGALGTVQ
ncbi:UNVERIFIED_CONTAM: hypothetical protein K2H54_001897 [Gekko kuhli]